MQRKSEMRCHSRNTLPFAGRWRSLSGLFGCNGLRLPLCRSQHTLDLGPQSLRRAAAPLGPLLRKCPASQLSDCAKGGRSAFARSGPAAGVQQETPPERFHAALSAVEISVSVAFSASLTGTPPAPRNPPSLAASATCRLICCSQLL